MDANERLQQIASIIELVDQRCMAADGPVTTTQREITPAEITRIYRLAKGRRVKGPNPAAAALGRLGGLVKSERKTAANKINARKAGRPRRAAQD